MIKVVVAEDYDPMRKAISEIIELYADLKLIGQVVNGFELLLYLNRTKILPDVIVIDVQMPLIDGLSVSNILKEKYPEIAILCISFNANNKLIEDLFDVGIKGFVAKSTLSRQVFYAAISALKSGRQYLKIDDNPAQFTVPSNMIKNQLGIKLSSNERTFLQLSATTISYSEIAALMNIAETTIYNYQKSLKEKLGLTNRHEFVLFALQYGIARVARYESSRNVNKSSCIDNL